MLHNVFSLSSCRTFDFAAYKDIGRIADAAAEIANNWLQHEYINAIVIPFNRMYRADFEVFIRLADATDDDMEALEDIITFEMGENESKINFNYI